MTARNTVKETRQDRLNAVKETGQNRLKTNETAFEHTFKYTEKVYNVIVSLIKCKLSVEDQKEENEEQLEQLYIL